jgi:ATP-dependent DNA helicase RecG
VASKPRSARSAAGGSTQPGALPLAKLGLHRAEDLPLHLPLRYEDETRLTPIAALAPGAVAQVEGEVLRAEIVPRPRRMLVVGLQGDDGGRVELRFLHFWGSQLRQFEPGVRIRAIGEVRGGLFGLEMVHPRWRAIEPGEALPDRLTPVYPTVSGVGQARIRSAVLGALRRLQWPETVPADVLQRLQLPSAAAAIRALHEPAPGVSAVALEERATPEWQRVIFDELLAQQLSLKRARAERSALRAPALKSLDAVRRLLQALPFEPTSAQRRAWQEVSNDLARDQPMNRLLQGDVGSGKTVVAALAAAQAIGSGWQAAMMAPTELLAEQHWRKLGPWMEAIGARIAWLSGSLKESGKKSVRAAVAAGEIDLLVGTHALIEDSVAFERLGLAIVDEQHRFGVAQRLALRAKLEHAAVPGGLVDAGAAPLPHQLMMSATPIPRTLAMSYYADLDVSVIDELPPGRTPVVTRLMSEARRDELVERLRSACSAGRQVYWVCPLIEESESLDLQTAIDTHAQLGQALAPIRVGLVHGRMPPAEKQATMDGFARGEIQVLVATTVIEVGVDVPNASLMIIEHAERFGLAQLHQLRGRVGRGSTQSYCVLMYRPPLSPTARERLRTLHETSDGFEIARRDLMQRGPGELLGARQSGQMLLRFADLDRDAELVSAARETAERMLRNDAAAVDTHLERWLGGRREFLKA